MKGTLERLTLKSRELEGNVLGDPTERTAFVYLPPGRGSARLPSIYFLHPFMSSAASWVNSSVFSHSVPERLDALVAAGTIPPVIGVFPDGGTRLGGTQWVDSPAMGNYQRYLVREVLPQVDAVFPTIAQAAARAAVGRSSGGYGALRLGRDAPEVFGHLGSNAGDAFFEYCYLPDFPKAAGAFLKAGGVEAWFRDFEKRVYETKLRGDDATAINVLAMAASYSSKAGAPLGCELPFEPESARLREEVFARWLEQDPVRFVRSHASQLKRLASVFLDCGTRDEYNMRWGTRMVAEGLRAAGVNVTHEEFDDDHGGTNYRFDRMLTVLVPKMVTDAR